MKRPNSRMLLSPAFFLIFCLFLVPPHFAQAQEGEPFPVDDLLSKLTGWNLSEEPLMFLPETLFEYINGAAEIYLAYDFRGLTVIQFGQEESPVNLTAEIYEMSSPNNAFGIYSAERFPDSTFIPMGVQGYMEEGTLNFLAGSRYIKLICFEGEGICEDGLKLLAKSIEEISGTDNNFPAQLGYFPKKGLIANSEKFIQKNVLGYSFLHDGYFANYRLDGTEFDCFFIEGGSDQEAQNMLEKYLEAKKGLPLRALSKGVEIKDRYYQNVYLARVGKTICGVMKIEEGREALGKEYLNSLMKSLSEG